MPWHSCSSKECDPWQWASFWASPAPWRYLTSCRFFCSGLAHLIRWHFQAQLHFLLSWRRLRPTFRRGVRCASIRWSLCVTNSSHRSTDCSPLFIPTVTDFHSCPFLPLIFLGTASGQFLRPAHSRLLLFRLLPRNLLKPLSFAKTDRKSTRLNSSHGYISYAVFCLKKKNKTTFLAYI